VLAITAKFSQPEQGQTSQSSKVRAAFLRCIYYPIAAVADDYPVEVQHRNGNLEVSSFQQPEIGRDVRSIAMFKSANSGQVNDKK
jgi:hypothetical protein